MVGVIRRPVTEFLGHDVRARPGRESSNDILSRTGSHDGPTTKRRIDDKRHGSADFGVSEFERNAIATDQLEPRLETALLGLVGEVGSLVSALKKKRRDTDGFLGYHDAVVEELGTSCGMSLLSRAAEERDLKMFCRARSAMRPVRAR